MVNKGNIGIHSPKENRYRCTTCGKTFSGRRNTALYRLHHPAAVMTVVLTLLVHGCPPAAIVAALGLDERTVRAWMGRAGAHTALLQDQMVAQAGGVEARHVQADEIRVRVRGGVVWAGTALAVDSRFWLATVVCVRRNGHLVHLLMRRVCAVLSTHNVLLAVDGFAAYVSAARALIRVPDRRGKSGRPRLVWPHGFALVQVVKAGLARGEEIVRHIVVGTEALVADALVASHGGTAINTAYIERLNATLREHLAPLVRRRRAPAQRLSVVEDAFHLLRLAYNWCWTHESLRLRAVGTGRRYLERTPAMAAGLADHPYALADLLATPVHLLPLATPAPPRRGRPSSKGTIIPFPVPRSGPPGRLTA